MQRRKICVITGTRAEYGQLYWLMKEINSDSGLELQIIVTGMHLSPEFGLTYKIIEQDGFHINERVEMLISGDTPVSITKSLGLGIIGFADSIERLKPDIIVLFGDRYEILASAQAAMVAKVPIAHLHGGEATEGSMDEYIRHAITKMSHLHFVATDSYGKRVVQLGESPERVFNYGTPGLDNIIKLEMLSREELEKSIDFKLGEINFLITYHPVTLDKQGPEKPLKALLNALKQFPEVKKIFTMPNSDTSGRVIMKMINSYTVEDLNAVVFTNLGQIRYLSTLKYVDMVIGNSSSGIVEAPSFCIPTINLGERQRGRLKASSIIDCLEEEESIVRSIKEALSEEFQKTLSQTVNPYGKGGASLKIKEKLKSFRLDNLLMKKFYDL